MSEHEHSTERSIASKLAHELKNPVMAIKGLASTTLTFYDQLSDDERREFLGLINQEADQLARVAEQTVAALQIDSGEMTYHTRPEPLGPIVEAAQARVDTGIHPIEVDVPADLAARCDALRVRDVLEAVLDNASRFSPPQAPIALRAERDPATGDDVVVVRTEDRGPGVPKGDREQVFDRYVALRPPGYEDVPGAGLSMFIARAHITAMGGRIWIEDASTGGTVLAFSLPREAAPGD